MSYEYDVALSFAGEDRKFVEDCAEILRSLNIVFLIIKRLLESL